MTAADALDSNGWTLAMRTGKFKNWVVQVMVLWRLMWPFRRGTWEYRALEGQKRDQETDCRPDLWQCWEFWPSLNPLCLVDVGKDYPTDIVVNMSSLIIFVLNDCLEPSAGWKTSFSGERVGHSTKSKGPKRLLYLQKHVKPLCYNTLLVYC